MSPLLFWQCIERTRRRIGCVNINQAVRKACLWLPALPGAQETLIRAAHQHFFVPPYVGVRGWVGVLLDSGVGWNRVIELVREACLKVAPRDLAGRIGKAPQLKTATVKLPATQIDPFKTRRATAVLISTRRGASPLWGRRRRTSGVQLGRTAELVIAQLTEIDA
jgi:hypothetical protein